MAKIEFNELLSIGIDIGKDTFHLVGFDREGQRVISQQIKRLALIGCCQTNSNTSQSTTIKQIYDAQIWYHSMRAVVRFCL